MNTLSRELKNKSGRVDTIIISSNDDYVLDLNKNYKLVDYTGNRFTENFKNSIFGSDIGVKSKGFASVAIISTLIAAFSFIAMILSFRI